MESENLRQKEIEDEIEKTKEEIEKFQDDLVNEKVILKQKGEYEEMAKVIDKYQSKEELQQLIKATMSNKQEALDKTIDMKNRIEDKKKQLGLLISLLLELKATGETKQDQIPIEHIQDANIKKQDDIMEDI